MNHLHPLEILGKNFQEITNILEHNGIEKIIENLEEEESTEYCVSAKNEKWEILLGKNNRIDQNIAIHMTNFVIWT